MEVSSKMYGADDIAKILGIFPPTPEQRSIIEAPVDEPSLVIAGAGAGKTETMANRIIFLVANEFFAPDQILGLTFTKKARGELNARIKSRLKKFNMIVGKEKENSMYGFGNTGDFSQTLYPDILTYNAFAANITDDFGIYYGIDPNTRVLSAADKYILAKNAILSVIEMDNNFINTLGKSLDKDLNLNSMIRNMLHFNDNITNNLCDIDILEKWLGNTYEELIRKNLGTRGRKDYTKLLKDNPIIEATIVEERIKKSIEYRINMLKVVKELKRQKENYNAIDFSDQIALATEITSENMEIVEDIQEQYKVVILDEYQDTSAAQVVMLQNAFKNTQSIMAVGDPNQAIYGWRGASSANIVEFPNHFKAKDKSPAKKYSLMTSWRNSKSILKIANSISKKLNENVKELSASKNASSGTVKIELCASDIPTTIKFSSPEQLHLFDELTERNTQEIEMDTTEIAVEKDTEVLVVADYIEENWSRYNPQDKDPDKKRTAAVLCPARSDFLVFKNELDKRNIPTEIVGLGGLLELPEITDVIALISVAVDCEESAYLIRLLVSPRINLGPRDINVLGKFVINSSSSKIRSFVDVIVNSLIDDTFASEVENSIGKQETFSRIQDLASMIVKMKRYIANSVCEIIEKAIEILKIESELKIINQLAEVVLLDKEDNVQNCKSNIYTANINLNSFRFLAAEYSRNTTDESINNFLKWIELSKEQDNGLDMPIRPVNKNAVQIITIHGAKGLEWDVVCSTSNTTKQFLYDTRDVSKQFDAYGSYVARVEHGWLDSKCKLPDALTLDKKILTRSRSLELSEITNRYKYDAVIGEYERNLGLENLAEKRRLAYVAYTRAKSHLLITASLFVRGMKKMTMPTPFFLDAVYASVKNEDNRIHKAMDKLIANFHSDNTYEFPTQKTTRKSAKWPNYRISKLQEAIIKSARAVEKASEILEYSEDNPVQRQMKLLLGEYELRKNQQKNWREHAKLPVNLSTSNTVQLVENREKFLENLVCKMPNEPLKQSNLGAKFHLWIDSYYKAKCYENLESGNYEYKSDGLEKGETLDILVKNFLATKWALMAPHITEQEINYLDSSHVITARIDAIFELDGEYEIVDWKTGKLPHKSKINDRAIQLAIYRKAWLKLHSEIEPEQVNASFVYVAENKNIKYNAHELDILYSKMLNSLSAKYHYQ